MPERFSSLPDEALVFRLADPGSQFLPADAELPLPSWFEPSSGDVAEGEERGRPPGLSVWDRGGATVEDARKLTQHSQGMAFSLKVALCKSVGERYQRELTVVADPLDAYQPEPGWDAHSLIEGLKRPPGGSRHAHKDLLVALAQSVRKIE